MGVAQEIIQIVREVYGSNDPLPLHAPVFRGNERKYVDATIESTFVSSVGSFVNLFEEKLCELTGAHAAIAVSNGTSALFIALMLAGVKHGDMVITQSLTFVATANAIAHAGAFPAFVDIEKETLGLDPAALEAFLENECEITDKGCLHTVTGRRVSACVPMHTFGFPCRITEISAICSKWHIALVEDAAEALGSTRDGQSCGVFGRAAILSFNGNKICTTGGGGAILTNDPEVGQLAKHITTTAKIPHPWRFMHDMVGYNFRLPNLNAALGCAQLEQLPSFVEQKREIAKRYKKAFDQSRFEFLSEPSGTRSNYWLNAILTSSQTERDACLSEANAAGVMTRPVWDPMHTLPMFKNAPRGNLSVTEEIAARLINLPSGVPEWQAKTHTS